MYVIIVSFMSKFRFYLCCIPMLHIRLTSYLLTYLLIIGEFS